MTKCLAISRSDVVFIMLINVKMSTIVGILTFMSRIILCSVELSMRKVSYPRGQVSYFIHFPRLLQQIGRRDESKHYVTNQYHPEHYGLYPIDGKYSGWQ